MKKWRIDQWVQEQKAREEAAGGAQKPVSWVGVFLQQHFLADVPWQKFLQEKTQRKG